MAHQRVSPGGLASPEASVFAAHFPANIIRRSHPFRGAGAAGPAGVAELRTVPAGSDGAGDPGASRSPDRAAPAGVAAAAGEGPSGAGPQAPAAEGGAADPGPDGRGVRGPLRERAGVREPRERE